jgi:UDP-N-acetylmuramoyl-tripeptide--D-alanyl-D-alanine ligase
MGTVEAVAHENGAVISALGPQGVAVFPADDAYTPLWSRLAGGRQALRFALSGRADVTAQARWQTDAWQVEAWTPAGSLRFSLALAGQHNVKNALAATACAIAAGVPLPAISAGLSAFCPVKGRSRALALRWGEHTLTLVDDSYNANPDSMRAAIDVLADLPAPRLLVMGDMGEVGTQGPAFHAEAAAYAQAKGIEALFTLGVQSQHASAAFSTARHFADMPSLLEALQAELPRLASVLVKGSRFMQMERAVEMILQHTHMPSPVNKEAPHAA